MEKIKMGMPPVVTGRMLSVDRPNPAAPPDGRNASVAAGQDNWGGGGAGLGGKLNPAVPRDPEVRFLVESVPTPPPTFIQNLPDVLTMDPEDIADHILNLANYYREGEIRAFAKVVGQREDALSIARDLNEAAGRLRAMRVTPRNRAGTMEIARLLDVAASEIRGSR